MELSRFYHGKNDAGEGVGILEGLESEDSFEQAHKMLGEMIGFDAGKIEDDGSPDLVLAQA